MKEHKEQSKMPTSAHRREWKKMELSYLGNAVELIQAGGGKLTPAAADSGEPRKTKPSG
jgi:hypothetical protein